MTTTIRRTRTARKGHRCTYAPHDILPGERYIEEVAPPWLRVAIDVDDDGRSIVEPLGSWETLHYHAACQMEREYGA